MSCVCMVYQWSVPVCTYMFVYISKQSFLYIVLACLVPALAVTVEAIMPSMCLGPPVRIWLPTTVLVWDK